MAVLSIGNEHPYQLPHLRSKDYKGPMTKPVARAANYGSPKPVASISSSESNPYNGGDGESAWKPVGRRARQQNPIKFNGVYSHYRDSLDKLRLEPILERVQSAASLFDA
jgi:hypothetical protein